MSSPPAKKAKPEEEVKYSPLDFTDPNSPHDRVLVVGEQKFYVYAGLLNTWSEFFRIMFNSNFKEKDQTEIELKDIDADIFGAFLQALIPGSTAAITGTNYMDVSACARRFLAPAVLDMCQKFILSNFDNLDKFDLLRMAFEYNWENLKVKLMNFLIPTPHYDSSCPKKCSNSRYYANSALKWTCVKCNGLVQKILQGPGLLDSSSFLVKNEETVKALPAEIQLFLFNNLLNKAKNYC